MPPRTIVVPPTTPGPSISFQMPAGVTLSVESVFAQVDNSAGGDTTGLLEIADSSGAVIARKAQGAKVTGGTSAGSATWALRLADESGGGGGGDVQLLWEFTVGPFGHGDVDTLTDGPLAGPLSQAFKTLEVVTLTAIDDVAAGRYSVVMRFNGDAGAHYPLLTQELAGSPPAFNNSTLVNTGVVYATTGKTGNNRAGSASVTIPGYSSVVMHKSGVVLAHGVLNNHAAAPDEIVQSVAFSWAPLAVAGIDRIRFLTLSPGGAADWQPDSYFAVYGRR